MKKAGAVLGPMLKRLGIESGVRLERIRNEWFDLFDPNLSSHMFPAACIKQELLLHVDSPAWMQQLTYYKTEIIRTLSPYGITDVRFRLGRVRNRKQGQQETARPQKLSDEDRSFVSSTVKDISDEELKTSIRKAMEKSLAYRKRPVKTP